jgi:hypothetical protein
MSIRKTALLLFIVAVTLPAGATDLPEWMAGSWSLDAEGRRVEEHWTTGSGGMMVGMGKTVAKGKATFEFFRIAVKDGTLTYLAMPQARQETAFRLKTSEESRVVFENLAHDFPQRILYWRDGETLCARIEGLLRGKLESEEWCYTRVK